mmetsp:Transcript_18143/g.33787  ORF Transcript_18143/g.33787 Transcript_18143/m.33787 type:complete len:85 (+) Transcript_18143:269-523(+)
MLIRFAPLTDLLHTRDSGFGCAQYFLLDHLYAQMQRPSRNLLSRDASQKRRLSNAIGSHQSIAVAMNNSQMRLLEQIAPSKGQS